MKEKRKNFIGVTITLAMIFQQIILSALGWVTWKWLSWLWDKFHKPKPPNL
jgi:hypothetical protein